MNGFKISTETIDSDTKITVRWSEANGTVRTHAINVRGVPDTEHPRVAVVQALKELTRSIEGAG